MKLTVEQEATLAGERAMIRRCSRRSCAKDLYGADEMVSVRA
ncbi:MAG: hypothetical protein ACLTXI_01320 [Collinsella sp.]